MKFRASSAFVCLLAGVVGFAVASRAADRTEAVHFAKGKSAAALKGSIKGDNGVVYQLSSRDEMRREAPRTGSEPDASAVRDCRRAGPSRARTRT
jgi:hypothetical protein